jgi:hypothetical protein
MTAFGLALLCYHNLIYPWRLDSQTKKARPAGVIGAAVGKIAAASLMPGGPNFSVHRA